MANITSGPQTQNEKCPLCVEEYEKGRIKKEEIYNIKSKTPRGIKAEHRLHKDTGPKTGIGEWMVNYFIPQYENNVMAMVYLGAAFLVFIVGLRGVGEAINNVAFVPDFLIDTTAGMSHLSNNVVILALLLEFFLITTMAFVMFFKPEQPVEVGNYGSNNNSSGDIIAPKSYKEAIVLVKEFFIHEIKSPLTDELKKKQVQEFMPIMDYYINEDNPNSDLDNVESFDPDKP